MTRNPQTIVAERKPYFDDIFAGVVKAYRNLLEVQPGFPANTPGSGNVGGGSGGISDRTGRTAANGVETYIDDDGEPHVYTQWVDTAARDLARLNQLMGEIIPDHRKLREARNLVVRWNYLTAGEVDPGLLARTAASTEHAENEQRWCKSCNRVHNDCNPATRTTTIEDEQIHLCDWCYKFWLAERLLPPTTILEARRAGRRISEAMVKAAVRDVRGKQQPAKPKAKKKKRK